MPVGAPFESHVEPYSQIRVDDFTNTSYRPAWVNLLSHIHSDHTQGLSAPSFSSQVVCSKDTKNMLLLLESVDNRINFDNGVISQRKRTFAALQRGGKNHRDLLLTVPLNSPNKIDISPNETATITLLDANHCPGSVMFLIEGKRGAILHTGDLRAEPAMISQLTQNIHIAPYLFTNGQQKKQLEAVYLDTASFIGTQIVPPKACAVKGLVDMIAMYPDDTLFYINIWTWGYEDILLGIAERFNTKIHVDRHKYLVLCSVEHYNPSPSFGKTARPDIFKHILTCDESETRFHACERYNQCTVIKPVDPEPKRRTHRNSMAKQVSSKRVVWVNPGVVASSNWESYIQEVNDQLQEGQFVDTLKVPLSRHSTLTELQSFIKLLRPKNIYPSTISPPLEGLDWACLPGVFAEYLTQDGFEMLRRTTHDELRKRFPSIDLTPDGMVKRLEQVLLKVGHPDLEQENAMGSDEIEWTEARFQRATKTKEHIEAYLPWLFGRQDIPGSETPQYILGINPSQASTIPPASPSVTSPTTALMKPEALCSTCANCSTCRPNPPDPAVRSSRIEVRLQGTPSDRIDLGHAPLADIGSSKLHTINSNIIPVQRNEQMYSPPRSPELRPSLQAPTPVTSTAAELSTRPKKRLRTGPLSSQNLATIVKLSVAIDSPPTLLPNQTSLMHNPSSSLAPVQPNSSPDLRNIIPEPLTENLTTLDVSRRVSRRSPLPNNADQVPNMCPSRTIAELSLDVRLPYSATKSSDNAAISTTITSSSTASALGPVALSESDTRERRRISKLKERDIRVRLAKLPPEFSRALAATKLATKPC